MKLLSIVFTLCFFATVAHAEDLLYIGDSHSVGQFGVTLENLIQSGNPQIKVKRQAISGSSAPRWSAENGIPQLQKTADFKTVIIALGTNDLAGLCKNPTAAVKEAVKVIEKLKPDQKCIWIGPPLLSAQNLLNGCGGNSGMTDFRKAYQAGIEAKGCRYVDSSQSLLYPNAGDGVHFGGKVAERWAAFVYSQIGESFKSEAAPLQGDTQKSLKVSP